MMSVLTSEVANRREALEQMITYHPMDETCTLTTCLHGGTIPLEQCRNPESANAYIETVTDIPQGSVARVLRDLSLRYGAIGIVAVEDKMVVGKIRCWPQAICDKTQTCVQQEGPFRGMMALDLDSLPTREQMPVLRIECVQVAAAYAGRGIAGKMLDALIDWAKANGWRTLRAMAVRQIPPLLNWCGQAGCDSLQRRGFAVVSEKMYPELREGVVSQRGGHHGPQVQQQWEPYACLSHDEAAVVYEMTLGL